jgi:flagellar motor protein MotB
MADKKANIIIKKIKKGGHGGHHGGAWKVAYADFVTAMMCFFLVMWLMGADEATKAAIASYFNDPSAPELARKEQVPLGNQVGAGDTIVNGDSGAIPEDLVQKPQVVHDRKPDSVGPTDSQGNLSREDIAVAESISFTIAERELFEYQSSAISEQEAGKSLKRIQRVAKNFHGKLMIRTLFDHSSNYSYESQMNRLVNLKDYIIERNWLGEDLISVSPTKVMNGSSAVTTEEPPRYQFVFTK